MAQHRILSVGQCAFDHGNLARHLARHLDVRVIAAGTSVEALDKLRSSAFDLVLVNRVGDRDGTRGVDLIRMLKADPGLAPIPVMLVSNYPEAQAEAIALGALPGFGKSELNDAKTLQALKSALEPGGGDPATDLGQQG